MALSLKDAETDRLAREVAKLSGESPTEAVRKALAERLQRERRKRDGERLDELAREYAALPDYDTRSPEEIVGYEEYGAPR